jgi:ribosomal protein S18 acetylase RimI-like enzyme
MRRQPPEGLTFSWAESPVDAEELAEFFVENVPIEYISYGEFQVGRAANETEWATDLRDRVQMEFRQTIADGRHLPFDKRIGVGRVRGGIRSLAVLSFITSTPARPYGVLEDLVVGIEYRRLGAGRAMLEWLERELVSLGVARLFLESSTRNLRAREFFLAHGYGRLSEVLMKTLSP